MRGFRHSEWQLLDGDARDDHGLHRLVVAVRANTFDFGHDFHAGDDLSEHRVLGRSRLVPPIKEGVVHSVDKELASSTVRLARVCHRQSSWLVGEFDREFVRNITSGVSLYGDLYAIFAWVCERGAAVWSSSTLNMPTFIKA